MALIVAINDAPYTFALAAATEAHITLDGAPYSLVHLAIDAALVAVTNPVFISNVSGITASGANGAKFVLLPGYAIDIPVEWRAVYMKTAAGAPILSILPRNGRSS